jgi:hypothetical protein
MWGVILSIKSDLEEYLKQVRILTTGQLEEWPRGYWKKVKGGTVDRRARELRDEGKIKIRKMVDEEREFYNAGPGGAWIYELIDPNRYDDKGQGMLGLEGR